MPAMGTRLLLISNSTQHGSGYLDHCEAEIRDFLGGLGRVLFVPFALHDQDAYAARARERFSRMGYRLDSIHEAADPGRAAAAAEAFFVGGGNTFRLLARLYELDLIEPIRRRVERGAPYIGASAGSNVACVTIKTTNDMPIVQPPSFDALGLVPFNLNCHYLDPDPTSTHQGETRELRIREFHEMNEPDVLGIREGAMLRVEPPRVELRGRAGARLFRRGAAPAEHPPGARLDSLLGAR
jgi:dipeptidase E